VKSRLAMKSINCEKTNFPSCIGFSFPPYGGAKTPKTPGAIEIEYKVFAT
jgi:hypothetical protein